MKDWKQILYDIYAPEVGSIWAAPNGIWANSFASNKSKTDYHPSVVGKVSSCMTSCQIVPGTERLQKGSCVFKVQLNTTDSACLNSYFLIDLWMTFSKNDLLTLKQGWNGIDNFNEQQLKDFKLQIKFCKGIDV
ncbi:MAG: hypothetical protein IPN26_17385 [Bacteroidetes bacterium]|nr:hypothetical protein [Bacteroidota bacterium]